MFLMGKDVYEKIVEIILKDIVDKKFHMFRGEGDEVKRVIFYDADELVLRHMCACADRAVGFDKDFSELKGVRFARVVGGDYRGRVGDYIVKVKDMIPLVRGVMETTSREAV